MTENESAKMPQCYKFESYQGQELFLFLRAFNWKTHWSSRIAEYLRGDLLEVGAGVGGNIPFLLNSKVASLTLLEPDESLNTQSGMSSEKRADPRIIHHAGTLADLSPAKTFQTILYIDVLEHIANDSAEVNRAIGHLKPSGHLVILAPAHQSLFSEFDRSIGHQRRYSRHSLQQAVTADLALVKCEFLDSVGFFASFVNQTLLKQSLPTLRQVLFWDRVLIPFSRLLDPLLGFRFGKSILGVWKKCP